MSEAQDFERVRAAIALLARNWKKQPGLDEMAAAAGLSPAHFQRLFTRWAGISPTRFVQYLTLDRARRLLASSRPVLETALETGLSGPGRLHDLFVTFEALSPGEYKRKGEGLVLRYGFHQGPFGRFWLAASDRGVCGLAFADGAEAEEREKMRLRWPKARLVEDKPFIEPLAERVFHPTQGGGGDPLGLHIAGTNFQVKVWEALMAVPPGNLVSYNDLAQAIGREKCPRAIGNALGANPIAYLIPCHRVIRATGAFNDYRWGTERKLAILGWEQAR